MCAGVIAAALTGAAGEVTVDWFGPGGNMALGLMRGGGPTLESVTRSAVKNAALTYGVQGGILGLFLGLAGAASRRSARGALIGSLAGLVLGGAAGVGASLGAFTTFLRVVDPNSDNLVPPLLAHAAVWGLVGAAGGLAFGVGLGRGIGRAVMGGLLGAVVGAGLYEFAGAMVFPSDRTTQPIAAARLARLFAHALTDVLAALGAALAIGASEPHATTPLRDPS